MEQKLPAEHDEYSLLKIKDAAIESSIGPMAFLDAQNAIIYGNPAFVVALGYDSGGELAGLPVIELFHQLSRAHIMLEALHRDKSWSGDMLLRKKDGLVLETFLFANTVFDRQQTRLATMVSFVDMTSRMKTERMLLKLTDALEQTADSIFITDTNGTIEYVNRMFVRMTGYAPADIIGENARILKSGKHDKRYYENMWGTILDGNVFQGEMINKTRSGELLYEEQIITPIKDIDGTIMYFISSSRDITERKRLEHLQDQVQSIIRHDLKTPLTNIIGYSSLLMSMQLPFDQHGIVATIKRNGERMHQMIDNSLDLYKMEEGLYRLRPTTVDLIPLLRGIVKGFSSLIREKKLEVGVDVDNVPCTGDDHYLLDAEPQYLGVAFENLIKNAIEASPEGGPVTVSIRSRPDGHDVRISNLGLIPADIRDRFFEKFATSGKSRGTGLGAYSALLIVKSHGGTLTFTSTEDEGTVITVHLPRTTPSDRSH